MNSCVNGCRTHGLGQGTDGGRFRHARRGDGTWRGWIGRGGTVFAGVVWVAVLLVARPVWSADTNAVSAQDLTLTFVHVNDVHGQMSSFELNGKEGGGYPRLATLVGQIRARSNAARCFLLHAGDEFSVKFDGPQTDGTVLSLLSGGAADIAVMNTLRFDAWTPGNGEFYGGLANLQECIQEAQCKVLTANILLRATGRPLGRAYVLESAGPVKVAFFGLGWVRPESLSLVPVTLLDPIATARKLVPELRRQADVVVALTHIGLDQDGRLAEAVEGVDLILGGHSHNTLPTGRWATSRSGHKTLICQAGLYMRRVGVVEMKLALQEGHWRITGQTARLVPLDEKVVPDESITSLMDSLAKKLGDPATPAAARPAPAQEPAGVR